MIQGQMMKTPKPTGTNIRIDELVQNIDEFEELIRSVLGFFNSHVLHNQDAQKLAYIEANTYSSEVALAIASLTGKYSNKRAKNLFRLYFNIEADDLNKEDVVNTFQTFINPMGAGYVYRNTVHSIINAWGRDMLDLHNKNFSVGFIPNGSLLEVYDKLDGVS